MKERSFIAIDLKSFYASVECVDRGLDPLDTNLVVADMSRTEKTICLAVSPSLKSYGVGGRPRLYEVIDKIDKVNEKRRYDNKRREFRGSSYIKSELDKSLDLKVDYIIAPPQMARYMQISSTIYEVYLKYIAPSDIHVYSIDEVFIDATDYLNTYKMTAQELAMTMIKDVLNRTGVTATAGIGTNLYLAKVAMDIVAKHIEADENGVRIASLDEYSYRHLLWDHKPLKDFWRVGNGYVKRLEALGLYSMGDIAKYSLEPDNEDRLYKEFGISAELLIDHAFGYEPCMMSDIKAYKPANNSIGQGQVLHEPYTFIKAKTVLIEMVDSLSLDLVYKHLKTAKLVLTIGYDISNLFDGYKGEITYDHYGRKIPKHAHGTISLDRYTSSFNILKDKAIELYTRITDQKLYIRRINIVALDVIDEDIKVDTYKEIDLFSDYDDQKDQMLAKMIEKDKKAQRAIIDIKKKYGKNAILKGTDFLDEATGIDRNSQVGGHKA